MENNNETEITIKRLPAENISGSMKVIVDKRKVASVKDWETVQITVPNGDHIIRVGYSNWLAFQAIGESIEFTIVSNELTSYSKLVTPVPTKQFNRKYIFSFSNICAYIVMLVFLCFLSWGELEKFFILKFDNANKEALTGKIISEEHVDKGYIYHFSFVYNGEIKEGSFEASGGHSAYSKGDNVKILYNKKTGFAYGEEYYLSKNIMVQIVSILFFPCVPLLIYILLKNYIANRRIVNKQQKTENKENTK